MSGLAFRPFSFVLPDQAAALWSDPSTVLIAERCGCAGDYVTYRVAPAGEQLRPRQAVVIDAGEAGTLRAGNVTQLTERIRAIATQRAAERV